MVLLTDILYGVRIQEVSGSTKVAIEAVEFDSRKVKSFTLFVAVAGSRSDGHDFVEQAIKDGAIAVICEKLPDHRHDHVTYVRVDSSSKALGICASNFYDNPSEKIQLIGITGTNGKTTCVTLLHNLSTALGYKAGLISTVVNLIGKEAIPATHTTPDAVGLNALLAQMVEAGCEFCFMEVSSHAVDQNRIAGLNFRIAAFTNISRDHLDYHETFDKYIHAKKSFFDSLNASSVALYNMDDQHGETMVEDCPAKLVSFGLNGVADLRAKILENQFSGLVLNIDNSELWTKLIGGFNAYNLLTVYGIALNLGWEKLAVLTELSKLDSVEGRFQYLKTENNITAIVDYAHTPDALENVLKTIKDIRTGNEKVYTVVGCGGDRDKGKRPLMAQIAAQLSDQVILTSDNPRSEDPEIIIQEMLAGVEITDKRKTLCITNRKEAIRTACTMAISGDIVLVAGKGHEKYQIIKDETFPFDDMEIVSETLKMMDK